MSDSLPFIRIDQAEAVELIEIFEFVESWLAQADPAVDVDFERFIGSHGYSLAELRTELTAWTVRLALAPAEFP